MHAHIAVALLEKLKLFIQFSEFYLKRKIAVLYTFHTFYHRQTIDIRNAGNSRTKKLHSFAVDITIAHRRDADAVRELAAKTSRWL